MGKQLRKAQTKLKQRQQGYDEIKNPNLQKAMKRPGSMNRHKQGSGRS